MASTQYSTIAKQLERAKAQSTSLLANVRTAAKYLSQKHGYSLECFSTVTHLHRNTVMKLSDTTWQPNPETLELLEELIVEAGLKRAGKPGRATPAKRGRRPKGTGALNGTKETVSRPRNAPRVNGARKAGQSARASSAGT